MVNSAGRVYNFAISSSPCRIEPFRRLRCTFFPIPRSWRGLTPNFPPPTESLVASAFVPCFHQFVPGTGAEEPLFDFLLSSVFFSIPADLQLYHPPFRTMLCFPVFTSSPFLLLFVVFFFLHTLRPLWRMFFLQHYQLAFRKFTYLSLERISSPYATLFLSGTPPFHDQSAPLVLPLLCICFFFPALVDAKPFLGTPFLTRRVHPDPDGISFACLVGRLAPLPPLPADNALVLPSSCSIGPFLF